MTSPELSPASADDPQVQRGMAWHYKAYQRGQPCNGHKIFVFEEGQAKAAKRGLLFDFDPVPTWDFRKAKRGG